MKTLIQLISILLILAVTILVVADLWGLVTERISNLIYTSIFIVGMGSVIGFVLFKTIEEAL